MGGAQFIGRVVSNRMQKTVVVAVSYMAYLPKLKTYEKRTAKHFAHADGDHAGLNIGDVVRIKWARRMSKHKHYQVSEVLRRANVYAPELGAAAAAARGDGVAAARAAMDAAKERIRRLQDEYDQHYGFGGRKKQQQGDVASSSGGSSSSRGGDGTSSSSTSSSGKTVEAGGEGPEKSST